MGWAVSQVDLGILRLKPSSAFSCSFWNSLWCPWNTRVCTLQSKGVSAWGDTWLLLMHQGLSHSAVQLVGPITVFPPPPPMRSAAGALRATPSHSWAGVPCFLAPFSSYQRPHSPNTAVPAFSTAFIPPFSAPLPRPHGIGPRCLCNVQGL